MVWIKMSIGVPFGRKFVERLCRHAPVALTFPFAAGAQLYKNPLMWYICGRETIDRRRKRLA
ncbi:MAG: hypothetical protein LBK73_03900 [Treponema sp.]|nr:hypothetical protein [Treponema sp.]